MDDRTKLLFALSDYRGLDVALELDGGRQVLVETVAVEVGGSTPPSMVSGP